MTSYHTLASLPAFCELCGGERVVVLEKHFIEEFHLETPLKVMCPHCVDIRLPIHHYYRDRQASE